MTVRLAAALLVLAAALSAQPARADDAVAAVRDESYRLDIAQRRIERGPYAASLQVGLDRPVSLRVGAALQATRIVVLLRGVRGTVRFHGDLSRLDRIAASHVSAVSAKENP